MKGNQRTINVVFADDKLKNSYSKLKDSTTGEKELYGFLNRAFYDLKKNPFVGIKIPKHLWPKEYLKKYEITNLWKYNLPNAWRLIYTIKGRCNRDCSNCAGMVQPQEIRTKVQVLIHSARTNLKKIWPLWNLPQDNHIQIPIQ